MQKLTARQAVAAIVAIWEAWDGEGGDPDQTELLRDLTVDLQHFYLVRNCRLTDAGRALLAEAPRTAEQERTDVVAYLRRRVSADAGFSFGVPGLAGTWATDIANGVHIGAAEARDGR